MGAVQIDIYKNEYPFKLINFSDIDCIKGLIKFRWMIDSYYGSSRKTRFDEAGDVKPLNQELISIYADLDNLIERCKLTKKQKYIIEQLMMSYTEEEVAERFKQKPRRIYDILETVALKIKKLNDLTWKYDYVYLNYLPVQWDYKICNKCNHSKPMIEKFFRLNSKTKDGFRPECRECESFAKKPS